MYGDDASMLLLMERRNFRLWSSENVDSVAGV